MLIIEKIGMGYIWNSLYYHLNSPVNLKLLKNKVLKKKKEQSLRELHDYNKRSNNHVIRVSGRKTEKGGSEKVLEDTVAEKFPNFAGKHKPTNSNS